MPIVTRSALVVLSWAIWGCAAKDTGGFEGVAGEAPGTGVAGSETTEPPASTGDGTADPTGTTGALGDPASDAGASSGSPEDGTTTDAACEDTDADGHCDDTDACASLQLTGNEGWLASPSNPFLDAEVLVGTVGLWFATTSTDGSLFSGEGYIQIALIDGFAAGCSDGVCTTATSTAPVNDGRWHHAVVTWDATQTALYFDGVLQDTVAPVQTPQLETQDRAFTLGKHANETSVQTVAGLIGEVGMWNERLAPGDIEDLRQGVSMPSPQLLWWPMSEGAGVSAADGGPRRVHGILHNGAQWSGTCPWADADRDGTPDYLDPDDGDPSVP
ncbi:MAG: LamG domain-containing protein [Myxococcota bacterium]